MEATTDDQNDIPPSSSSLITADLHAHPWYWFTWFRKYVHQRLLFGYFSPYMRAAQSGASTLSPGNLPSLWKHDDIQVWSDRYYAKVRKSLFTSFPFYSLISCPQYVILQSLFSVHKSSICIFVLLKIASTMLELSSIALMALFLEWQEVSATSLTFFQRVRGVLSGIGILCVNLSSIFVSTQARFWHSRVLLRMQGSLTAQLLRSVLLPTQPRNNKNVEEVNSYNMLIMDIEAITDLVFSIIDCCLVPLTIFTSYIILVNRVGDYSISGILALLLVICVMLFLQVVNGILKIPYAKRRDMRMSRCHNVVADLRCFRMLRWEEHVECYVGESRAKEMKYRKCRMYIDTITAIMANGANNVTQITVFLFYVRDEIQRNPAFIFKASIVIPVIQAINRLVNPVSTLPFTINAIIEGWVSCGRYYSKVFENTCSPCHEDESIETLSRQVCTRGMSLPLSDSVYRDESESTKELHPVHQDSIEKEIVPHSDAIIYIHQAQFVWNSMELVSPKAPYFAERSHNSHSVQYRDKSPCRGSGSLHGQNHLVHDPSKNLLDDEEACTAPDEPSVFVLTITELRVKKGECAVISGATGTGKTSLLLALLGNMIPLLGYARVGKTLLHKPKGSTMSRSCRSAIGYTCALPWIPKGTVQSIILFGRPMVQHRYNRVIEACELQLDIQMWSPDGDQRFVSEGGCSLSGGQRSRIALARALYGYPDPSDVEYKDESVTAILLLDNPFESLDPVVAANIFYNLFRENGLLKYAATVLVMDDKVFNYCTQLQSTVKRRLTPQLQTYAFIDGCLVSSNSNPFVEQQDFISPTVEDNAYSFTSSSQSSGPQEYGTTVLVNPHTQRDSILSEEIVMSGPVKSKTYWWLIQQAGITLVAIMALLITLMHIVNFSTDLWLAYWTYCSALIASTANLDIVHHLRSTSYARLTAFFSVFQALQWLTLNGDSQHFDDSQLQAENNRSSLAIFVFLSVLSITLLCTLYFLGNHGAIRCATVIHSKLLQRLVKAPYCIYELIPVEVIVNRFNTDVEVVDGGPLLSLSYVLNSSIKCCIGVIILSILSPWFCLMIPIIALLVYKFVYELYRPGCRELQRSKLVALSSLCGHLSELESGKVTIRAFMAEEWYHNESVLLTSNFFKTQFMQNGFVGWATIRLQLLSFPFTVINSVVAVLSRFLGIMAPIEFISQFVFNSSKKADLINSAGFPGLAISLTLGLPSSVGAIVWSFSQLEQRMCSVQRIEVMVNELSRNSQKTEPVYKEQLYDITEPFSPVKNTLYRKNTLNMLQAPVQGGILTELSDLPQIKTGLEIRDLCVSYHVPSSEEHSILDVYKRTPLESSQTLTLRNVSLVAKPGDCIGILGRTGSGKTTLLLALLNLLTVTHGSISIDTIPLSRISTSLLRKIIGILPQFPPVMAGWTVRQCLDPENEFSSQDLYTALSKVGLTNLVSELPMGLDSVMVPETLTPNSSSSILSEAELRIIALARLSLHAHTYRAVLIDEPPVTKKPSKGPIHNRYQAEGDKDIADILKVLFPTSIIIVVAHHATTFRHCNRLLIFSRGECKGEERGDSVQSQKDLMKLIQKYGV